jgi:hypothetical protein
MGVPPVVCRLAGAAVALTAYGANVVLLFGGGFRHGQHLAFDAKNNAPLGRLFVSMLQQLGLEESQFAHAAGTLSGLERV